MQKKALGRGLDALITGGIVRSVAAEPPHVEVAIHPPEAPASTAPIQSTDGVRHLPIDKIERSRFQPRTEFDPEHLKELAASIKQRGVIQPLLVRPIAGTDKFELIAGERRWRASKEAGLTSIPVLVRPATDEETLEIALIENLQREDLNPIEEARAYEQLGAQFHLTQEQIAEKVGRSRAAVANSVRLLALPAEVQSWLSDGRLSVGHAKVILGLQTGDEQRVVAERILRENLTVRATEQLVEQLLTGKRRMTRAGGTTLKAPEVQEIENRLQQKLGTRVTVRHGRKKGRIEIEYYSNDELSRLLELLGVENL
jgi:ParB family transcriptional regulator, chromosome partitioning protein